MGAGIIWDFDDTLVETTVFFETAREKFARYMVSLGFPLDGVLETLNLKDIENVRNCGGFMKDCFPSAMAQTYHHFCKEAGSEPDQAVHRIVEDMGWWVFKQKPRPVPGAGEVLEELAAGGWRLFMATKGDPSVQWARIEESGLKSYFEEVYVLRDKTRREFEMIARRQDIEPRCSWVVGNSIKSDINPGMRAGFNCIYIPNQFTWQFEMEDPLGDFVTLDSLHMVPGHLISGKPAMRKAHCPG